MAETPQTFGLRRFCRFELPEAFTWANMSKGKKDRDRREQIRKKAAKGFPRNLPEASYWALSISVRKSGNRRFDIENVPKPFVDAFCGKQIERDRSAFRDLALYDDDTIDNVRSLFITGERVVRKVDERTVVEIFFRPVA